MRHSVSDMLLYHGDRNIEPRRNLDEGQVFKSVHDEGFTTGFAEFCKCCTHDLEVLLALESAIRARLLAREVDGFDVQQVPLDGAAPTLALVEADIAGDAE